MSDINLETLEVSLTVDARGSACPGPLLEAKKAIGRVRRGQHIEVLSGDASTLTDLPRWAKKVGHEFLGSLEADGYHRIFLTRCK